MQTDKACQDLENLKTKHKCDAGNFIKNFNPAKYFGQNCWKEGGSSKSYVSWRSVRDMKS